MEMNELKHTKGPWECRTQAVSSYGYYIETVDKSHTRTFIGEVGGGLQSKHEIEANAKIIASAPELLEALMNLVGWDEKYPDGKQMDAIEFEKCELEFLLYINNAKDAIKKATE